MEVYNFKSVIVIWMHVFDVTLHRLALLHLCVQWLPNECTIPLSTHALMSCACLTSYLFVDCTRATKLGCVWYLVFTRYYRT